MKFALETSFGDIALLKTENVTISLDLFSRREGHPSKRVNPSWRAKDSPGLQAKFPHR